MREQAKFVVETLIKNGYEAAFIGGSVRNILHNDYHDENLPIKDYDIVTNASYEDVASLFDKVDTRGEQFKVAVVRIGRHEFEIAQYRGESYPEGGSLRPNEVHTVKTLQEDVQRRDFTINGLAQDLDGNIIDFVGGVEDLKDKVIRTIGDPNKRFAEDPLRMLRAIRFATQLNYAIDGNTLVGIVNNMDKLSMIPHERVKEEVMKMLSSGEPATAINLIRHLHLDRATFYNSIEKKQVKFLEVAMKWFTSGTNYNFNRNKKDLSVLERYIILYKHADIAEAEKEIRESMFFTNDEIEEIMVVLRNYRPKNNRDWLMNILQDVRGKSKLDNRQSVKRIINHIFNMSTTNNYIKEKTMLLNMLNTKKLFKSDLPFNGEDVLKTAASIGITHKGKWISKVFEYAIEKELYNKVYNLEDLIKKAVHMEG